MKKQILNLGKALNKAEQKSINGGTHEDMYGYYDIRCGRPTDPACPLPSICTLIVIPAGSYSVCVKPSV